MMSLSLNRTLVLWGFSAALLCVAPAAHSDEDAATTLRLKYIKPSALVRLMTDKTSAFTNRPTEKLPVGKDQVQAFQLPDGITEMTPDDAEKRLSLRGDRESVARMEKMAEMLDVPTHKIRLQARIVRYTQTDDNRPPKAEVIGTAKREVSQNETCEINAVSKGSVLAVQITPHILSDKNATLESRFVVTRPNARRDGQSQTATQGSRLIRSGQKTTLTTITGIVYDSRVSYGVEVTPTIL